MQENNNISIKDFTKEKGHKDINIYTLEKSIIICGKMYKRKAMEFLICKKHSLKNSIIIINEFINFIAKDWKDNIIKEICKDMNITEEEKIKWFNLLELYYLRFCIRETGKMVANIYFIEKTNEEDDNIIHNVLFVENKIESIIINCGDCYDIEGNVNKYLNWK